MSIEILENNEVVLSEATPERAIAIAELIAQLRVPSGRLSEEDLGRVVQALARRRDLFADLVVDDSQHRWWMQLLRTEHLDLRILSWENEQSSDWHDHGGSSGAFFVTDGALQEQFRDVDSVSIGRRRFASGEFGTFGPSHVHDVVYETGTPAVSIHAYSPALSGLTYYDHTRFGFVAREVISEEVRGQSRTVPLTAAPVSLH